MLGVILAFSALGVVGALMGSGLLLAAPNLHQRLKTPLLAYAIGTLLGAAFLGLLPEALMEAAARPLLVASLMGFLSFFVLEKLLRLPHVHTHAGEHEVQPAGWLILWGDALHNFIDGVMIATAFLVSVPLGVVTALAVLAHEVPQELGDFVILVHSGWNPWHAFWLNGLSATATVPGALAAYAAREVLTPSMPYVLAIAAGTFLYIAATDLAPILHHEVGLRQSALQTFFILVGIGTSWGLHRLLG